MTGTAEDDTVKLMHPLQFMLHAMHVRCVFASHQVHIALIYTKYTLAINVHNSKANKVVYRLHDK